IANVIVIKYHRTSTPAGSTIPSATLTLNLVYSHGMAEPTYTGTARRSVHLNPDLARATGYTYDGVNSWTPNTCCANNIPLAQASSGERREGKDRRKRSGENQ